MRSSLAARLNRRFTAGDRFWSCEVSPPKTEEDTKQLLTSISSLQDTCQPLFTAVSWHLGLSPCDAKTTDTLLEEPPPLKLASAMRNVDSVLLHLSSLGLTKKQVLRILCRAKDIGIRNIFAVRGDIMEVNNNSNRTDGFVYAKDLVCFIREHFGDHFTVGVAGYPSGHPDSESLQQDLQHLKEKVDAGADFILTQFFFDVDVFASFVHQCRRIGIKVPIIPGILPIQDYTSLFHIARICRVEIPAHVLETIQPIKDNPDAVRNYGISLVVNMVSRIFSQGLSAGTHFFTFNRMLPIIEICEHLGFYSPTPSRSLSCRQQAKSSDSVCLVLTDTATAQKNSNK